MTQVYFHCSNSKEVLVVRGGAVVEDLAQARDHAASVVKSLTTARSLEDWRDWILHVNDDLVKSCLSSPSFSCSASSTDVTVRACGPRPSLDLLEQAGS
jgi:hypothetical protein